MNFIQLSKGPGRPGRIIKETGECDAGKKFDFRLCSMRHMKQQRLEQQGKRLKFDPCCYCPLIIEAIKKQKIKEKNEKMNKTSKETTPKAIKKTPCGKKGPCLHCKRVIIIVAGGLCGRCYTNKEIKAQYKFNKPGQNEIEGGKKATGGIVKNEERIIGSCFGPLKAGSLNPTVEKHRVDLCGGMTAEEVRNSSRQPTFTVREFEKTIIKAYKKGFDELFEGKKGLLFTKEEEQTFNKAIDLFSPKHQMLKAVEELTELSAAIIRHVNKPTVKTKHALIEELADVHIMAFQLSMIFGSDAVNNIANLKIDRLKEIVMEA